MPSLNLNSRVNYLPSLNTPNQQQIYAADIPTNLNISPITGDLLRVVNKEAIDISLINICNTMMYERPYSNFGAELQLRVFENSSALEIELIKSAISMAIRNYESRVTVLEINITVSNDESYYSMAINYTIVSNPTVVNQLNHILQRTR